MQRTWIIPLFLPLLVVLGGLRPADAQSNQEDRQKPNIVWFITEDMGPDMACYGEPQAHTPNFDRVAEQGVRYTNVFSSTPVCSSNRSALMTGMHSISIDAQNHRSHQTDDPWLNTGQTLPGGVRVITDWLRPAGYTTGLIGMKKTDWNFNYEGRAGHDRPYDTNNLDQLMDSEPFFAQVQVNESHRTFPGVKKADPDKVEIPPYYPDHPESRKIKARYLASIQVADRKFGNLIDKLKEEGVMKNTLIIMTSDHGRAMMRGKDFLYDSGVHVPMLVKWPENMKKPALYEEGAVDDRLISQIDIAATTLWAAGIEPPMLMQGRVFLGSRARRLNSLSMPSSDGSSVHRRYVFSAQGRYDETEARTRSVRTKNYRYIRNWHPERPYFQRNEYKEGSYPERDLMRKLFFKGKLNAIQKEYLKPDRPREELYYIPDDPHNVNNLVNSDDQRHQWALDRLRTALDTWMMEANDQQRFPEDPSVLKGQHKHDDDPGWEDVIDNRDPEFYRRFRKLHMYWDRIDDDDANTAYRDRVWGDDSPFPLRELEEPIDPEDLPEKNLFDE